MFNVNNRNYSKFIPSSPSSAWQSIIAFMLTSVVEPEPPFLAGAVKKGAGPAPALQLKLQL